MTTVVVAEKPSVARDIARVLGANRKNDGYLEGNGYRVTWALGHLIRLAEPDEYGPDWAARWSLDQLPMLPERWKLAPIDKTAKQYKCVKGLLNASDTQRIVCATDAGREGELIFRLIHEHARCKRPFDRLWISSLTDAAIRAGLAALKPGSAFDDLARAARARAQADWLIGMNLTRAYTVRNGVLLTIGRVQTPTLAMIVARDEQIANFKKAYYYELVAWFTEGFEARYTRDGETRIERKEEAERLERKLAPHRTGRVVKVEQTIRRQRPPPLYDLTGLQRDANRRYGFTASKVLELAQTLYETHKLITYPRTESRHIPEEMVPTLPGVLGKLDHPLADEALKRLEAGHKLGKAYVDRTKLTDHHAILPTGKPVPEHLERSLRQIYDLIVARFVAIFLPERQVEETRVEVLIGDETFVARGAVVLDEGWKRAEPPRTSRSGDAEGGEPGGPRPLPTLAKDQVVHIDRLEVQEKETAPPRPYDDATLLSAMKNAGREIEDDALAAVMKDHGLGTPATRAEIIEKLIRTGYIERRGKQLRATDKGIALIGLVAEALRSPELTAEWEKQLAEIERGERDQAGFDRDIASFVHELVSTVESGPTLTADQVAAARANRPQGKGRKQAWSARSTGLGTCPICKQGEIVETAKAYGCSRYQAGCGLTIWKQIARLRLTEAHVRALLEKGSTDRIDGFISKAGKRFAASLRLDEAGKVVMDFSGDGSARPAGEGGASPAERCAALHDQSLVCPKCKLGRIIEGRRGYGCNRYREGCDFVVWKEISGKRLSEKDVCALIEHGETDLIDGFVGEHGESYVARLRLDEGRVVTECEEQGKRITSKSR